MSAQRSEGRTIVALCAYCAALMASYGFARTSIDSLYIGAHGSKSLPYAWLGVAIGATVATVLYGRAAARVELTALLGRVLGLILGVLALLLGAARLEIPGATYLLYLWKELYIVVLVEMFWTVANHHFQLKSARWLYGIFLATGALGGALANSLAKYVAPALGTENMPLLVFPLLAICGAMARLMPLTHKEKGDRPPTDLLAGLRVIRQSRYLGLLLALIATVQVVITLVDYQFNVIVEASYPDRDVRTGVIGDIYSYIDMASLTLQISAGLIVRLLGVTGTLLAVPIVLGSAITAFVVAPRFASMAVAKVASKALDYSVFRISKEMLYLPLTYAEQTQGKAVVDILTYRVAKGATSGLLLMLGAIGASAMVSTYVALGLVGGWLALIIAITHRYRQRMAETGSADDDEAEVPV